MLLRQISNIPKVAAVVVVVNKHIPPSCNTCAHYMENLQFNHEILSKCKLFFYMRNNEIIDYEYTSVCRQNTDMCNAGGKYYEEKTLK
jgi:hypothetical protein